jgi:hypothetical protein
LYKSAAVIRPQRNAYRRDNDGPGANARLKVDLTRAPMVLQELSVLIAVVVSLKLILPEVVEALSDDLRNRRTLQEM